MEASVQRRQTGCLRRPGTGAEARHRARRGGFRGEQMARGWVRVVRSHSSQGVQGSLAFSTPRSGTVGSGSDPCHASSELGASPLSLRFEVSYLEMGGGVLAHIGLFSPRAVGQGPMHREWVPKNSRSRSLCAPGTWGQDLWQGHLCSPKLSLVSPFPPARRWEAAFSFQSGSCHQVSPGKCSKVGPGAMEGEYAFF